MGYTFKSPVSAQEWHDYFLLRWQILRAPWQQPRGSEQDSLEADAFHLLAKDDAGETVGVGRIHRSDSTQAQIRYMAVAPSHRERGIGGQLLVKLEEQANAWGCKDVVLNARTTSLQFYLHHGYQVIADAPTLFGCIPHKRMCKPIG